MSGHHPSCKHCGAPVDLAPDGDPRFDEGVIRAAHSAGIAQERKRVVAWLRTEKRGRFATDAACEATADELEGMKT